MTAFAKPQSPKYRGSRRLPRAAGLIAVALLAWASGAWAQVVDSSLWVTDGPVSAIVRDGNTIYIGGAFSRVGRATGGGVALRAADGSRLQPFPTVLGNVLAVMPDGSGGWFIGGEFTAVGGSERFNLAHVLSDGSVAPWAPNPNGPVYALAVSGGTVYAGGSFTWIGMRWRDNIAAVSVQTGVASSWNPRADGAVRALKLSESGSVLYVGGGFQNIGGQARRNLAALDAASGAATAWTPGANAQVSSIAVSGGVVYVGGDFSNVGGQARAFIAALDATTALAIPTWNPGANSHVQCLTVSGNTVYAGGNFTQIGGQIRRYMAALTITTGNLTAWESNADNEVAAIAVTGNTIYAGGRFESIGNQPRRGLAALDAVSGLATGWDPSVDGATYALALDGGAVFAGGSFTMAGARYRNSIAALDATTGIPTAWNPSVYGSISTLALSDGILYAGGGFSYIGGAARTHLAALVASTGAVTPWDPRPNDTVAALAVSGNTVYAGGWFTTIGGSPHRFLAALDGTTGLATNWNPYAQGTVHALALGGGTLYAGGSFSNMGGTGRNRIAALDTATALPTAWNPSADGEVRALALSGGTVYAGGTFGSIGGAVRSGIAALDASTGVATDWNPAPYGAVYALAVSGNTVYAGGTFTQIGGQARNRIAALEATTGIATLWNPDASAYVSALAVSGGTVYAGGDFRSIGPEPRGRLAAIGGEVASPSANPTFTTVVSVSTTNVAVGESVTITASVRNDGAASDDGRIVFSFKDLTDPLDAQRVSSASSGDTPGYRVIPGGSPLLARDCGSVNASYLVAEYADGDWTGFGSETNTLSLTVRPKAAGVFSIDVRSTMHAAGGAPCDYASDFPADGGVTLTDQQGWTVRRFVVYVDSVPALADPIFTHGVSISNPSITLGQSVTISTAVHNAGALSDDGRIVFSFPALTDPLDAPRVTSASSGDTPGFRTFAPGATLADSACRPVTASYLVAEYADTSWAPIGHEINSITVVVQPREAGTFVFDVRSTMRTAGGDPCGYVNRLPVTGQAGFTDQQGWEVRRFSFTVLAPPTAADPEFWGPLTLSADSITLGQAVTIQATVRDFGLASDDGRIVFAFPALTESLDVQRVTGAAANDYPGFRVLPAGSALLGMDCQPVAGSYLVAEYADNEWLWIGTEANSHTAFVTPREVGDFIVEVRSTMHTAGGAPCGYANDLPSNGQAGFTDQQGWPVKRFVIKVGPAPVAAEPVFTELVSLSTTVLEVGQLLTISATVRNLGAASDDGRIVMSFPALTDSEDVANGPSGNDTPGFRVLRAGSQLVGVDCQPVTASYLVAEYADSDWQWIGFETNVLSVTVRPREIGTFFIDVRTTMRTAGGGPCDYVNVLPANGVGGNVDQQGWAVRRFTVTVGAAPPTPNFTSPVYVSAGAIDLGQSVTIAASVRNEGGASDDGRVVFSFPGLTDPLDAQRVIGGSSTDLPGYRMLPAGSPLISADCQPVTAGYLVAEYADADWRSYGTETNACTLTVRPRNPGTFTIELRSSMHLVGGSPCALVNALPSNGQGGTLDQQGWSVRRFTIIVNDRPTIADPVFIGGSVVSTDVIGLGEAVTVTAVVSNAGAASDDGRIVVSFPALNQPGDAQWVTSGAAGDSPGFRLLPSGSTLLGRDCQPVTAQYLVAEYADASWEPISDETNTFALTVRPPREGLFTIEVRSTMRTAGGASCDYVNDTPASGQGGFTDQQGWTIRRFEVLVGSPASMTWRQVGTAGSGPVGRAAQSAVFDPGRDELVLYGGTASTYTGDSWALPVSGGSAWSPLLPGGPVPLRRIMHSMVHNPVEDHLLIFGGYYDDFMNDLWVLSRTPTNWWFPIDVPGLRPSPRLGHTAIYDPVRRRMLVIGGFGAGLMNDVWEYSPMVNGTWRLLTPAGAPMPARATHSAVYDAPRDRILIFGGDAGVFLNDVWELRLGGTLAWSPVATIGAPPSPRREHAVIYHAQWDQMVVFGGYDGARRNDVWTLSLSGVPAWERRFSTTPSPSPRNLHSAVYDPARARMLMFGGQLGTDVYSNEVWELTLDESTPVALALAEVEAGPGAVRLVWYGEGAAGLAARVERRTVEGEWAVLGTPVPLGPDRLVYRDEDVVPGTRYGYRLRLWQDGAEEVHEPVWVTVPARPELALVGASPNPVSDALSVAFTLPGSGSGALELFDLRGRLVARHELAGLGAGPQRVLLADGRRLAAGIYLVRLTHDGRSLTAKACVVR